MVPAFYYAEFSRQFRLWKRERSSSYVTDDKDENGRKGRVRKKRNYFKQLLSFVCAKLLISRHGGDGAHSLPRGEGFREGVT